MRKKRYTVGKLDVVVVLARNYGRTTVNTYVLGGQHIAVYATFSQTCKTLDEARYYYTQQLKKIHKMSLFGEESEFDLRRLPR